MHLRTGIMLIEIAVAIAMVAFAATYGVPWDLIRRRRALRRSVPEALAAARDRISALRASASAAQRRPAPRRLKPLRDQLTRQVEVVLKRCEASLRDAARAYGKRPEAAAAIEESVRGSLDVAAALLELRDVALAAIQDEYCGGVRKILRDCEEMRAALAREIGVKAEVGFSVREEAERVSMLANAFLANESVVVSDPDLALQTLARQRAYLAEIARSFYLKAAVEERVRAVDRQIAERALTARRLHPVAVRMLEESPVGDPVVREALDRLYAEIDRAEDQARLALAMIGAKGAAPSAALAKAETADALMRDIEHGIESVLAAWSADRSAGTRH